MVNEKSSRDITVNDIIKNFKIIKIVNRKSGALEIYYRNEKAKEIRMTTRFDLNIIIDKQYEKFKHYDNTKCSIIYDFIFNNHPDLLL